MSKTGSRKVSGIKEKICVTVLLTAAAALALAGCGKKGTQDDASTKDFVYKIEELYTEQEGLSNILTDKKNVYGMKYEWVESGANLLFYQLKEDGTKGEVYSIFQDSETSYSNICMDENADLYCVRNVYHSTGEDDWEDLYYLCKMSLAGEEFFSLLLNDIPELNVEEADYFYCSSILLANNAIYVEFPGIGLGKFSLDGTFLSLAKDEEGNSSLAGASFVPTKDGKVVAITYNETGQMEVAYADLDKGTRGESYLIPGLSYEYSFYPAADYDLYMVNSYDIYGYNVGDADRTKIMSFVDSDFSSYGIFNMFAQNSTEFLACYNDIATGNTVLARFTKVPPEEVVDKQVITLACASPDWNLRMLVVDFNKSNDTYRVTFQDYDSLYNSGQDYSAGINRLNADIASGKMPDILLLDDRMPIESYINKGLFEDFYPYMDQDQEINREDYVSNVLEAYSVNGKLYRLVPAFRLFTLMAKSSVVGEEPGWTIKEVKELLSSMPEGTKFLENVTREDMMNYCMSMTGEQFVDWENGQCHFDTGEFMEMLEFVKSFPEEIEQDVYADYNYEPGAGTREGSVIAMTYRIGDFRSYNYVQKAYFGEAVTMIGFPGAPGGGTVLEPSLQIAMSSRSKVKEGAWEFLRTMLTEEYQAGDNFYGFPLRIKQLQEKAEEATRRNFYVDENGQTVEYDDTAYINGVEVVIDPMTEQEAADFVEQIYGVTQVYTRNQDLLTIVEEEAAPFFAGQKDAKSVADVIQRRARIYVSENS